MRKDKTFNGKSLDDRASEFTDLVADFAVTLYNHNVSPRECETICRGLRKFYLEQFGEWKSDMNQDKDGD